MKVLYLTYDGLTDPLGQSQVLPYLAGLSRLGHEIHIVSFEKPVAYNRLGSVLEASCKAAGLAWYPLKYHKHPPILSTIYDVLRMYHRAASLASAGKFDWVHCRSYLPALAGARLKRKFGVMFLFDMRGFWADERVEGGLWNLDNPLYRLIYNYFKRREKMLLSMADKIVCLTENAARLLEDWGVPPSKIDTIPTCVDLANFNPEALDPKRVAGLRDELGLSREDFVLLYLGSLGTWYRMDDMLAFFDELKMSQPGAKFLVVSRDSWPFKNREDVIVRAADYGDVPLYLSLASASVMFIHPSFSKIGSSATKMGELLAMGVPIFCNLGWGDMDRFKPEDGVLAIADFKTSEYRKVVVDFLERKYDRQLLRKTALRYFNLPGGIQKYNDLYQYLA